MNYDSITNQRIIGQLVNREIIQCVSHLVQELTTSEWIDSQVEGGCVTRLIDEETAIDAWQRPATIETILDNTGYRIEEIDDLQCVINTDEDTIKVVDDPEDTNEVAEACDTEVNEHDSEVFEHWIVTEWLSGKLQKQGEQVIDILGLTVWCRTTTGQGIASDYVIGQIAEDMEILKGQRNDWSRDPHEEARAKLTQDIEDAGDLPLDNLQAVKKFLHAIDEHSAAEACNAITDGLCDH